jgi:flagellar biosynthesis protein FlhG
MRPLEAHARTKALPPVQVIAVSGGKGGTGKSSVAVNLATALTHTGRRTLLLDGDLGLANVDVLLGLTPRYTLEHVLRGERTLEEVIVESSAGVRVVPAASGIARMAALSNTEQAGIIQAFATLPEPLEIMIVDTAAGICESVLQFCQSAQQVLLVLRDEPAALTDTYALIKVLSRERGVRLFRVIANMTRERGHGELLFRRLQRVTDRYLSVTLDYNGEIPEDAALHKAVQAQRAVLELYPSSPSAHAFRQLARAASRWPLPSGPSGRVEFFFERMLARPAPLLQVLK